LIKIKKIFYSIIKQQKYQATKMIYATIPSKYLVKDWEDIIIDKFDKLINGNKYTPEQHFVDFILMLQDWLEMSQEDIMECETSEEARRLGHNMKHLNTYFEHIRDATIAYFKTQEAMDKFMNANNNHQLSEDIKKILLCDDGELYFNSFIIGAYGSSPNVVKFLDSIGCDAELRFTRKN
jgi:hypothetical protein